MFSFHYQLLKDFKARILIKICKYKEFSFFATIL
ncbi:hypothetical protein CUP1081 [Campylobacter upsaliensis RM3195]|nr:hypothetical protein CUP1081 [Campylobacter upsaliensis RM3195]